jgi:hypothetical protein
MKLDESAIDLHGWLRAFYSCQSLGRSFVMDNDVQRPLPSYANISYGRSNYASVLKEVLNPLGLKLVQGKWIDAVVLMPPKAEAVPASLPAPLWGARAGGGAASPDSGAAVSDSSFSPPPPDSAVSVAAPAAVSSPRRLRAKASGLLKSSARRLGVSYSEFIVETDRSYLNNPGLGNKYNELWRASARASDSLGSTDFARVIDFISYDTARVVFGSEIRRPEENFNYESGNVITKYGSVFDGLTVEVKSDRWSFVWRGSGSVLEVPGLVGSCASGSSKIVSESRAGIPFLSSIPVLKYLFSYESNWSDELLVAVCVEEVL